MANMRKEKCRLENREPKLIHKNGKWVGFKYEATVTLPNGKKLTFRSNNDIQGINFLTSKFSMSLDCNDGRELDVLYSEFYAAHAQMRLKSIRVPDRLRNYGLGKCILEAWLRLLPVYAELHNIQFSTIEGDVIPDSDFAFEYTKKLYAYFDGFEYGSGKKLTLDTDALTIENKLRYIIESV